MSDFPCNPTEIAGKMNGPGGATNAIPDPNRNRSLEDQVMADDSQYRDSATAIKPIETVYRGYRFRSRLEARWAVFFDALGLTWEYEPEGFERGGDRYLPDFRLTLGGAVWWVEVKGEPEWLGENLGRIGGWLSGEPIIPGGRLLLLGGVPEPTYGPLIVKTLLCRDGVACTGWAIFEAWGSNGRMVGLPDSALLYFQERKALAGFQPFVAPARVGLKGIQEALLAARMARFEHGASGAA